MISIVPPVQAMPAPLTAPVQDADPVLILQDDAIRTALYAYVLAYPAYLSACAKYDAVLSLNPPTDSPAFALAEQEYDAATNAFWQINDALETLLQANVAQAVRDALAGVSG